MTTSAGHYYYGLGRRKTSIARVRLYPGNGQITVNGKDASDLFRRPEQRRLIDRAASSQPVCKTASSSGRAMHPEAASMAGGKGAIRLGIARALLGER